MYEGKNECKNECINVRSNCFGIIPFYNIR